MRELDRLARDAKWSNSDLAARLGVHPTMLMHLRAGRNLFSAYLLGRIAQLFPSPAMDELIVHHLRVERAARDAAKLVVPTDDLILDGFDPAVRTALRTFVLNFARATVQTGRGLYLEGDDPKRLALAAQFIMESLQPQGIAVERMPGNVTVAASHHRAGLAAALLIVERVEFASPTVMDLLHRRSDVVKPMVITSTLPISDVVDRSLARTFLSMLRQVRILAPSSAIHHAA